MTLKWSRKEKKWEEYVKKERMYKRCGSDVKMEIKGQDRCRRDTRGRGRETLSNRGRQTNH